MFRKLFVVLICWGWACGLISPRSEAAGLLTPVRAAYVGIEVFEQRPELFARLRQHGFTVALAADGSFPVQAQRWQALGAAAQEQGMPVIGVVHFAVPRELRNQTGSYRPYVNRTGMVYAKTPCPTDADYWQTVIGDQFLRVAEHAGASLAGVVFDAEMYGSDINWYADVCYCDACWQQFYASDPSAFPAEMPAVPADARFRYLTQHHRLQAYTTVQWHQVRAILSGIERQVRQRHPALQLGFLCYQHNWFFTALVHGLGTENIPALVFSESSYVRGYTPYVDAERDSVGGTPRMARYIPGIWLERFAPETLPAQLVDAALQTDGHWVYTSGRFWRDEPETENWRLNGSHAAYWAAMQRANAELRRGANRPLVLHRTISPVRPSSFYDPARQQLLTTPSLRQHLPAALDAPASSSGPLTYRGQTLFHCRPAGIGSFRVTHIPLSKDPDPELLKHVPDPDEPVTYQVFDDQGLRLHSGVVTPAESPETVTLPGNSPGLVSILIASKTHGFQVSFLGLACVAEASSTYPLATFQSAATYRLYAPATTERFNLRVEAPRQESAVVTLHPPFPAVAQQIAPQWFAELHAPNPVFGTPSDWRVRVEPSSGAPFGDVRWYLYDAEFPYVRVSE